MTFWLLLGLGLLAVPAMRRPAQRAAGPATRTPAQPAAGAVREPERGPPHAAFSARTLQLTAALAVTGTALVLGGPTVGGLVAAIAGPSAWAATAFLHARPVRGRPDPGLPLALDLAAAALRAGRPVPTALELVAPVLRDTGATALVRTARLLALGADPHDAWAALAEVPALAGVAVLARRSATSGVRLAAAFEKAALELRAAASAAGLARAHRAGSLAVAPLGLCFLPAFVCLGIVPVVAGMAHSLLTAA